MVIAQFFTQLQDAPANFWGSYRVEPTPTGIRFQVSVRDPRNNLLLAALIAFSVALAVLTFAGFWAFIGTLVLLLMLAAIPYFSFLRTRFCWIEIRPDGLTITPSITWPETRQFFHRDDLSHWELDFDKGLNFRCGIYDIAATPGFADHREFEIFEPQLNKVIARLWHQQNL